MIYTEARQQDPTLAGRFTSVDPLAEKYYSWSPYVYCMNNPINAIDPDGRNVIFLFASKAVESPGNLTPPFGHAAVMIGNEDTGWTYYSMNGTASETDGTNASLSGESKHADVGTPVVDEEGNMITDATAAMNRVNTINPNSQHSYDKFLMVESNIEEDQSMKDSAAKNADKGIYSVLGQSCLDVAQGALETLAKSRGVNNISGSIHIIPNSWAKNLVGNIGKMNKNLNENQKMIISPMNKKK